MGAISVRERANQWRQDAGVLRRYGHHATAELLEKLADDLEADILDGDQRVGLEDAVHITGYSKAHLRRLMRSDKLSYEGTKKKPSFLLADLPRKPGHSANKNLAPDHTPDYISTYGQVARAVVQGD